jgi:hypothetical protein
MIATVALAWSVVGLVEVVIYAIFVMPSIGDSFVSHIPSKTRTGIDISVNSVLALWVGLVVTVAAAAVSAWGMVTAWRRPPGVLVLSIFISILVPYLATGILSDAYRELYVSGVWGIDLFVEIAPAIALGLGLLSILPVFRGLRRTGAHSAPGVGRER